MQVFSVGSTINHSARHLSCLPALDMKTQSSWTAVMSGLCQRREPCSFQASFHECGNSQSPGLLAPRQGMLMPRGHNPCQADGASASCGHSPGYPAPGATSTALVWSLQNSNDLFKIFLKIVFVIFLKIPNWSLGISTLSSILKCEILSPEF